MEILTYSIDGYTRGTAGLAVGTSLAFEELALKEKETESIRTSITQFRVNIHTLVRNISEALEDELRTVNAVTDYFFEELELLEELVKEYFPNAEIVYYVTELDYYRRVIPRTKFRSSKSKRIRTINEIEHSSVGNIYDMLEQTDLKTERISTKKGHITKTAMVLTHLPADLLCFQYYSDMFLIESHTGRIRRRNEFTHRILPRHRREHAQFIPFNHLSFQVYGDGGKMLEQAPGAITTRYTELARAMKWNYGTSKDKIISDINKSKDDKLIEWFAR